MNAVARESSAAGWQGGLEEVRSCPACGGGRRAEELRNLRDLTYAAAGGDWHLQRCLDCRCVYLDPRPSADSLHLAYRNYFTHGNAEPTRRNLAGYLKHALANGYRNRLRGTSIRPAWVVGAWLTPCFGSIAEHIRHEDRGLGRCESQGRVLDVGCGNGQFLQIASRLGWRSFGVEPDTAAAAAARRCGEIVGAHLNDLDAQFAQFFDVITLSHVIEHVPDPQATFRDCVRLLRPGGRLWLETPNIDSAGYQRFGAAWRGLETPRHLLLFNSNALTACLYRAGFERVQLLQPRDVTAHLFLLSARIEHGRIAELQPERLPSQTQREVRRAIAQARRIARTAPGQAEFVTAVAYAPRLTPSCY